MNWKHTLAYLTLPLALLHACARPGTPTGGIKDTTPPVIDSLKSTPNFSTHFNEKKIELSFDEWVVLKEVTSQVVISPPVVKKPELRIKGKTVIVEFDEKETFRENTTYTVNFGTAVRDLHEDNPAQDLRFVFSTGDVIDSLQLSGIVVDAYSGEGVENVAVMLYDQLGDDSIPVKERPYYFARTNKSGQFTLSNLRGGVFKCVAIEDANQNLRWDSGNERLAFPDSTLTVSDSTSAPLSLRLFKNRERARLLEKQTKSFGKIELVYTARVDSMDIRSDQEGLKIWKLIRNDSIQIWYDLPVDTTWNLIAGEDTVSIKAVTREEFLKSHRLQWGDIASAAPSTRRRKTAEPAPETAPADSAVTITKTGTLRPGKAAELPFNAPVLQADFSKWKLWKDSTLLEEEVQAAPDSIQPDLWRVATPLSSGSMYRLQLDPGAVTDLYGVSNTDTLVRLLNVPDEKQLGSLNLTVSDLVPGQSYVLQLYNDKLLEEEYRFTADDVAHRAVFTKLPAVVFTVRLIEDLNANGRWDTGDYYAYRQPELIFTKKLEALRANWEVEAEVSAARKKGKRDRF